MRKNLYRILLIVIVMLVICTKQIYATDTHIQGQDGPPILSSQTIKGAQEMLKNWAKDSWSSDDGLKWAINVDLKNNKDASGAMIGDYLIPSGADYLGCNDHEPGETWNAWLEIELIGSDAGQDVQGILHRCVYGDEAKIYDPKEHAWGEDTLVGDLKDAADTVKAVVDWVANFGEDFVKNPMGTIINYFILNPIRTLADGMQILANMVQTVVLGTKDDMQIMYSYKDLKADGEGNYSEEGSGNRNKYVKVKAKGAEPKAWQIQAKDIKGKELGFTDETKIPVIPGELYSIANGTIDFFDINFIATNSDHKEDSAWMVLKNFATLIIRMVMYITSAILIVMLIWHGIHIVKGSIDSPEKKAEHKKGLQKFAMSLLMMVGSIIVVVLCIYATKEILSLLGMKDGYQLPIRVNVETKGEGYSFSTNVTGYVRYMCEIEDVDLFIKKTAYIFPYFVLALINLVMVAVMMIRTVLIMFVTIVGPILALQYAIKKGDASTENYKMWIMVYASLALMPVAIAIVYKLILKCVIL